LDIEISCVTLFFIVTLHATPESIDRVGRAARAAHTTAAADSPSRHHAPIIPHTPRQHQMIKNTHNHQSRYTPSA
ncbi:hypothetical protein ACNJ7K_00010, partial [Rhodococcus aetherivorans]